MINSLKVKEVYNKRAKKYDAILEKMRYHKTLKSILHSIPLNLNKGARILDIGCGTGLVTEVLMERYPESVIVGFDYSEEMLKLYKERFSKINAIIGDFNSSSNFLEFPSHKPIELEKDYFDLIISTGAVSEYGNKDTSIPFIYTLLKSGGTFINIGIKKNAVSLITSKLWHYKPIGKKNFVKSCESTGFTHTELIRISWNNFPTNFTKFVLKARK